jgi:hypothetical protein
VLAVIIALGVIVMALSSFTNAARNLLSIFSKEKESANVTGTWKTQALTNQFNTKQKWTFTFEFDEKDTTLLGTVTLTPLGDDRNYKKGIQGGKIEGRNISFYTQQTAWLGTEKMVYKDLFMEPLQTVRLNLSRTATGKGDLFLKNLLPKRLNRLLIDK